MFVAVDVGQRHRAAAVTGACAGLGRALSEFSVTAVEETQHAFTGRSDEQVQPSVAVHIGKHSTAIESRLELKARLGGDVFESPATEISKKGTLVIQAAEEQIHPAIVIEIACGDAGAIVQNAILGAGPIAESVGEDEASSGGKSVKPTLPGRAKFKSAARTPWPDRWLAAAAMASWAKPSVHTQAKSRNSQRIDRRQRTNSWFALPARSPLIVSTNLESSCRSPNVGRTA